MSTGHHIQMLKRDLGQVVRLFENDDVTEWGKNPSDEVVWTDTRSEGMKLNPELALSHNHAKRFLNRVADQNDLTLTSKTPVVEASLPAAPPFNGARLTGVVPPIVPEPEINVRILPDEAFPLEAYTDWYEPGPDEIALDPMLNRAMYDGLVDSIRSHHNIFVVGGTGSGKTTLAMSILKKVSEVFPDERIVTMEDTRELTVHSWSHVPLLTSEMHGHDYDDLIKLSLRLSPDRLVMGECRGPAVLSLFDSVLTGHPGAVSTFHSQSVSKALRRMMIYCRRSSDTDAHHFTIGDAVDLMVVINRSPSRGREITQMGRVIGYAEEDGYEIEPLVDDLTVPERQA